MGNTNFHTIIQMPNIVNSIVKQATGREAVQNIDMDYVTVAQQKKTGENTIDFVRMASFVNNNELPLRVLAKITAVQSGEGDPAPDNVRPITGWTGAKVTVSPTTDEEDGTTYDITFPSEAGTVYGGTLDVTNGVLTVEYKKFEITSFTGLWNATNPNGTPVYVSIFNTDHGITSINRTMMKSNIFVYSSNVRESAPLYSYGGNNGGNATQTFILPGTVTTLEEANAWLADNPTECIFRLTTPVTVQLTPTEIDSLIGENNLFADTGDVSVSYTTYYPII